MMPSVNDRLTLGNALTPAEVLKKWTADQIISCLCPFCDQQWLKASSNHCVWNLSPNNAACWPHISSHGNYVVRELEAQCWLGPCTNVFLAMKAASNPPPTTPNNTVFNLDADLNIIDPGLWAVTTYWSKNSVPRCACDWCQGRYRQSTDGKRIVWNKNVQHQHINLYLKPSDCVCCALSKPAGFIPNPNAANYGSIPTAAINVNNPPSAPPGGCVCKRCNMTNEYAAPNQPDGRSYICYGCR